jgi:hypothetical protein
MVAKKQPAQAGGQAEASTGITGRGRLGPE